MNYIKESIDKQNQRHFLWNGCINVYNSGELPEDVDISSVLDSLRAKVPLRFLNYLDSIMVGEFSHLEDRKVDAAYQDGAIYVHPKYVRGEADLADDIVHELAHAIEDLHQADIYADGNLEDEFLRKRVQLYKALKLNNIKLIPFEYFTNVDFSELFDDYLYMEVGYPTLETITTNMFVSPYGATSLREYFANGFEEYIMYDHRRVKELSPELYEKIKILKKIGDEDGKNQY